VKAANATRSGVLGTPVAKRAPRYVHGAANAAKISA
jgi:hypothetical protein